MQDVITKFNALVKAYKDSSASTKNDDGSIKQGALAGDSSTRAIISQLRQALTGESAGLPGTSAFSTTASLGIRTNPDGTLTLDAVTFQAAITKDPAAAMRLFTFTGDSNNGVVAFKSAGAKTATGTVGFTIDSFTAGGAVSGTFTGTPNGPITLTGSNGVLIGGPGDLEGLTLGVTALGSGTLTLSRGAGQATRDLIASLTATGTGSLANAVTNIDTQNRLLTTQIDAAQSALDRRKIVLQAKFSQMETAIGQMKAAAGQLSGL
jgi:flagellar hook-associated protein 2